MNCLPLVQVFLSVGNLITLLLLLLRGKRGEREVGTKREREVGTKRERGVMERQGEEERVLLLLLLLL